MFRFHPVFLWLDNQNVYAQSTTPTHCSNTTHTDAQTTKPTQTWCLYGQTGIRTKISPLENELEAAKCLTLASVGCCCNCKQNTSKPNQHHASWMMRDGNVCSVFYSDRLMFMFRLMSDIPHKTKVKSIRRCSGGNCNTVYNMQYHKNSPHSVR